MRDEIGSLCSGFGGLDRALAAVLRLPVAWHAEIEKLTDAKTGKVRDNPVCQVLDARYPGLPNHGDITAIDWTSLARPRALAAGFPCQAVSGAGLQLAEADPRWLWPAVRVGIAALRPEWLAIENVANLVPIQGGELWRGILADLAALGYSVAWGIFGACLPEVGGCHHRHRVFALARLRKGLTFEPAKDIRWSGEPCGVSRSVAMLPSPRASDGSRGPHRADRIQDAAHPRTSDLVAAVAHAMPAYAWAVERWTAVRGAAPAPTAPGPRGGAQLRAQFSEWMMGLAPGFVTDVLPRKEALHAIGNGVFPLQAYRAFGHLFPLLDRA